MTTLYIQIETVAGVPIPRYRFFDNSGSKDERFLAQMMADDLYLGETAKQLPQFLHAARTLVEEIKAVRRAHGEFLSVEKEGGES